MAETKTINLDVQSNLGSLKSQLREAQAEVAALSDKFGATSAEAANAAKRAAELKDRIEDAKNLTDAFNPDAKFNALSRSIGGALNGFQAFEGAMGLVGSESEALQKTLLKVQSAMALSQGVQGVMEAKDSFVQLGAVVKNAFAGMTTASKVFLASGIGLVVAALGLLIAKWDDVKAALTPATAQAQKFAASTAESAEAARSALANFDEYEKTLKRLGYTEEDIAEKRKKRFKEAIDKSKQELQAAEKLYKSQKRDLESVKTFDKLGLNATGRLFYGDEETAKNQRKHVAELRKQLEKLKNDEYAMRQQAKEARKQEQEDNKAELEQKRKEAKDRAKEAAQKRKDELALIAQFAAEAKRNAIEQQQELDKALEDIAEQNYLNSLSEQDREIRLIQDKYFELETRAKGNADALKEIEIAKLNEINDINLKYQDIAYKQQEEAREKEKEAKAKADADKIEAEKAVAETMAAIREADFNNIFAGLNLVKNLFENNKKVQAAALIAENAVSIAKTILSTKAANQAARAQGTALAITSGGASVAAAEALIIRNNIGAGISIAAQIAATAKGLSALKAGGSPSGGGGLSEGGTGSGGNTPNFNVVGNSGMNQLAQIQQTPVQAFVVSGEVTSAQALDRNRIKNATL